MRHRKNLTPLGHARVYRHDSTGDLVVDTDTLRRSSFAGDDFGADEYGDDDEAGDEELGDDFAGPRRLNRRKNRLEKRISRIDKRLDRKNRRRGRKSKMAWGMTAVGGIDTVTEEGAATVKIRLQHHFKAEDVTFTGSASGATVTSIFFGDRVVWSNSDGIDVSVFASNSFMRGLLRGQSLRAGLDITVNGAMPGAGNFSVTIIGKKPLGRR